MACWWSFTEPDVTMMIGALAELASVAEVFFTSATTLFLVDLDWEQLFEPLLPPEDR